MATDYKHIRRDYTKSALSNQSLPSNPIEAFRIWFDAAIAAEIPDVNAMVLSTVNKEHKPSSRLVLLKDLSENGLVFFTNYSSRKGEDIANNPNVCVNFFWQVLERQVRVEGKLKKVNDEISDAYFKSRPRESQLGAICSPQSKNILDRSTLEELLKQAELVWLEKDPERPKNWGGYELEPNYFEFWQGGANRLHDRITYTKTGDDWKVERIAP
jgi:pyridoxamine 5'-phosphate oxidase